jgi:trehalose 6-phosphate synthase/phosphatase
MAGSAKELSEAILVNPNDKRALAESLLKGLEMPLDEQSHRLKLMQESLRRYTIFQWVKLFNQNLAKTKKEQSILHSTRLKPDKFEPITSAYAASQQKLVFLDYDGTLVPFDKDPEVTIPDKELRNLLQETAAVEQLDLVLISGRPRDFLEKYLGHLPITLAAEHGIWLRTKDEEWQPHAELPDERWKEEARSVIDFYVNRTPGSFLEEKQHALAWHYRSVETGLARLRCSELSSHLKHMLGDKGLEVLEGNAVVEIKPASINKGVIAHNLQRRLKPDFTLAIGDDRTDEDIFEALPAQAFTIKVGDGQTRAQYSLDDHEAVRSLLKALLPADS